MNVKYLNDLSLVIGLQNREEEAFEVLIEKYGDKILRLCFLMLKDKCLAEDVAQEIFIQIYKCIFKFKNKSCLYTWIYRIAINKCRDQLKKKNEYVNFDEEINKKSRENVEDEVLSSITGEMIKDKIMKLKPIYREVLILYYYHQLSIKEICEVLNDKENTVKSRLKRGREILKEVLIKEGLCCE